MKIQGIRPGFLCYPRYVVKTYAQKIAFPSQSGRFYGQLYQCSDFGNEIQSSRQYNLLIRKHIGHVVLQVVLTEKLLGTGSGTASLTNLQAEINKQAAKGHRLHTISTTSSGSKGFLGGDKIQATMVFERLD